MAANMKILQYLTTTSAIAAGIAIAALAAAAATTVNPQPQATFAQPIVVIAGPSTPLSQTAPAVTPVAATFSAAIAAPSRDPILFNNGKPANGATWFGATLGDGKNTGSGWPKTSDMQYMVDLGVKAIRLPIAPQYCLNADGTLNTWVVNTLAADIKFNMSRSVSTVLDAHTYLPFTDPAVASFWSLFAPAIEKAIGGATPLFGIELTNEPGKSSKDLNLWTEPLRKTIKAIRIAGYKGYIFAGAGDWNNMTFLPSALVEVERTGGITAMDPLNLTIYTGHDYWNKDSNLGKTRNDQGAAVDGNINIAKRYDPALRVARRIGAKVVMSEIGGGISPDGPLPAFNGIGKNGKQLQEEYFTYAKANQDVLIGTWFWMAGKTSVGYRHKIEAGNPHTRSLQTFWKSS
jgi:aryl-phospho-beta-D-glucosidase BglC (GH1 family)